MGTPRFFLFLLFLALLIVGVYLLFRAATGKPLGLFKNRLEKKLNDDKHDVDEDREDLYKEDVRYY